MYDKGMEMFLCYRTTLLVSGLAVLYQLLGSAADATTLLLPKDLSPGTDASPE